MNRDVFVNRTLNLKRIKYIGLDMDHTLVRYKSENFEKLAYKVMIEKLVKHKGYPKSLYDLEFDFNRSIRGLVIDGQAGNLLKLSRHGAIRTSQHGLEKIDYKTQRKLYGGTYVDLSDPHYYTIDTIFSISHASLYAQLIDLKDNKEFKNMPDYSTIAKDLLEALDLGHRDDSIKGVVKKDLDHYLLKDPETVEGLEKFIKHGKKIFILTNSDFHYTKLLLDYCINPFLKNHKCWEDLFEVVITGAQKPRFFYDQLNFLKVNPDDGSMINFDQPITRGIYQGGCASKFTNDLNLNAEDILYIGDHIYGDIVRLKKDCSWRTALVIEELEDDVKGQMLAEPIEKEIDQLMQQKLPIEVKIDELISNQIENDLGKSDEVDKLIAQAQQIDQQISPLIQKRLEFFNPIWGPITRVGIEESFFGYQVERFADIYMSKLMDLLKLSPRTYFRSNPRPLPHETYSSKL